MPSSNDPFDLARFVDAQDGVHACAVEELKAGQKRSHWMWFIFPQIAGLGFSSTARFYAIAGSDEARAYLAHPVLGPRLIECTKILNNLQGRSLTQIFGYPDNMKFRSSMTLFERVAGPDSEFSAALEKYCSGQRDTATLDLLRSTEP